MEPNYHRPQSGDANYLDFLEKLDYFKKYLLTAIIRTNVNLSISVKTMNRLDMYNIFWDIF